MAKCSKGCCGKFMKKNALTFAIVLGVIVGICMGIGCRSANFSKAEIKYFAFPGEIMLNLLKLIILPLIVTSLITGVARLEKAASGKLGLRTVIYYLTTTFIAVVLGIILVVSIRPGRGGKPEEGGEREVNPPVDTLLDLVRNLFPQNIIQATFQRYRTVRSTTYVATSNETNATLKAVVSLSSEYKNGINALGMIAFCLTFGVIIGRMEERGKILVDFFVAADQAIITMVRIVMWYVPIGIAFLIASKIMGMENAAQVLAQLGLYMVTVVVGLIIHGLIFLPLAYLLIVRKNPFPYLMGASQALFTALATASSSATLPLTIRCLQENNKVDERVVRFVLPIGATINMDGTALYEAVATIFIAQINDVTLSFGQIVAVSITATAASIGAAGVPEAGLVTLVIVLAAVGLPEESLVYILAVDWLLDRFRTCVNVMGDCIGTGIVAHLSRFDLEESDRKRQIKSENAKKKYGDSIHAGGQENNGYVEENV